MSIHPLRVYIRRAGWTDFGHRIKDKDAFKEFLSLPAGAQCNNPNGWVHDRLRWTKQLPSDWELTQCLFGEHLLAQYPESDVMIVESEKTAFIMSCFYPQFVWLATGGCKNMKDEKLNVLAGRTVDIIPDSGKYKDWTGKLEKFDSSKRFKYKISDMLETYMDNTDIADVLLGEAKLKE